MITPYWRLCCDRPELECECPDDLTLDLDEVQAWVKEYGVDPYAKDGGCDSCVFIFTAGCVPYREWMKRWIFIETEGEMHVASQTVQVPDELVACQNYRSD